MTRRDHRPRPLGAQDDGGLGARESTLENIVNLKAACSSSPPLPLFSFPSFLFSFLLFFEVSGELWNSMREISVFASLSGHHSFPFHSPFIAHLLCAVLCARNRTRPAPRSPSAAADGGGTSLHRLVVAVRPARGGHARSPGRARFPAAAPSCACRAAPAAAPACLEPRPPRARRRRPSGGSSRLRGRSSQRRAGRRTRPGDGRRAAACQVWRSPGLRPSRSGAGRRPDGATERGLSGGPAAPAFWRLGRGHPNSISPESVAGLRPGGFSNVMFV